MKISAEVNVNEALDGIIERYGDEQGILISVLQDVQEEFGYLPEAALITVARKLRIPPSRIYGIVTFYSQFHLTPRGRHIIKACQGTACHVRGGKGILEVLERELDLRPGETTEDLEFTLEIVRCIGCCSLAPVMVLDGKTYGRLTREKTLRTLRRHYGQKSGRA